jgi:hypothetical protein
MVALIGEETTLSDVWLRSETASVLDETIQLEKIRHAMDGVSAALRLFTPRPGTRKRVASLRPMIWARGYRRHTVRGQNPLQPLAFGLAERV